MASTESLDSERADLVVALDHAREFLRLTLRGLTDDQARQRTTVSSLCLGGLVKHVTAVERNWSRFIVEGTEAMSVSGQAAGESDAYSRGFELAEDETVAEVLEEYQQVADATDRLVASFPDLSLSHPLPEAPWFQPGASWSARRTLLHIVAETAQHAGHADIIRESLDGAKSMG
jgi:uncharacterized damage-inducible protein DinB